MDTITDLNEYSVARRLKAQADSMTAEELQERNRQDVLDWLEPGDFSEDN